MATQEPSADTTETRPPEKEAETASEVFLHPAFEQYAGETVPSAGVGAAGKVGELDLAFAVEGATTRLVRDYARVPFHLSGTLGHDPHPTAETVYIQSPSGGIAQGDRHHLEIRVDDDAVASVSTGSSTKVLSMERNYGAVDAALDVGVGGHLDYVPEPLILHVNARYCQRFSVTLQENASAIVSDIVVPGRLARGERFAFDRYASRLRVHRNGEVLVADDTHLHPAGDRGLSVLGVLEDFDVYGTLYVLAPDEAVADLADAIHETVVSADSGEAGATVLPNEAGVAVRSLGHRADVVRETLHAAWDVARRHLIGSDAPERRQS